MITQGDAFFDVDSRLLLQLGEKLVTNQAVALAELIKNSYDADATNVIIHMKDIKKRGGTITIEDDGIGMTLEDFNKAWMRIATIDKEENPFSRVYQRQKAGEKGIGRFACRRLSKRLILKSIAKTEEGTKTELNAIFEWSDFSPGSDVNRIPVKYSIKPVTKKAPVGTKVVLEDTNEAWDTGDIKKLRNEITDLISPITFKAEHRSKRTSKNYDPGFKIIFKCLEFPEVDKSIDKDFFKNAWAKLYGFVDKEGYANYRLEVSNKIISRIKKEFKRKEQFQLLKKAQFVVHIFSYRTDLFEHSAWKLVQTRRIGDERGGIKVYADKFRVFGYGQKGDDWLKVNYDRARSVVGVDKEIEHFEEERPGLSLFRNNNLFGHVIFPRKENPELDITINRERLIDNRAFEELVKFVRLGIDFATVLYAHEIYEEDKQKKLEEEEEKKREEELQKQNEEAIKKADEIEKRIEEERKSAEEERRKIESERKNLEEQRREIERLYQKDIKLRTKIEPFLKKENELLKLERQAWAKEEEKRKEEYKIKEKYQKEKKRVEEEKRIYEAEEEKRRQKKYDEEFSQLRVLASTGTLILIFGHELGSLVEDMEEMISNFSLLLNQVPKTEQKSHKIVLDSFSNRTEMIKELGEFLGLAVSKESRLEKKEWVLQPIVDSVFRPFKWYFSENKVEFNNEVPDTLRTPKMYRSELVSILHNLMSNAFKAVKGCQERKIEIRAFEENRVVHIQVLDSGKGLDKELWEKVFDPFETYSEPDIKFGVGTGLGLKLVKDFVRSYGGEVRFVDAPRKWKTCLEIILPKEG